MKNEIRRYLLGRLEEEQEEQLELRLLSDRAFTEEFDTIVDEITDEYVAGEFEGDERKRVEQYFLRAGERRDKLAFASALTEKAAAVRSEEVAPQSPFPRTLTFSERLQAFFSPQSLGFRFAVIIIAVAVVVALWMAMRQPGSHPAHYALLELTVSSPNRANNEPVKSLKLSPEIDAVKISLRLPGEVTRGQNYSVKLIGGDEPEKRMKVTEKNDQKVTVEIPASELKPGLYGLQVSIVNPDGSEPRVPGSYYFNVEE